MDERDVFISRMRQELEDKENDNRALSMRLHIVRSELEEVEKKLQEVQRNYLDVQERYMAISNGVMALIAKLKGERDGKAADS